MALQGLRSAFNRGTSDPARPTAAMPTGYPIPTRYPPSTAYPAAAGHATQAGRADAFGCPSCGRAIQRGTSRCPGCGQRLLLDVPARKASMLVGSGALAGFIVGGLLLGVVLPRVTAGGTPAGLGPAASAAAGAVVVPANAAAALRGTTILNGRLAAQAEPLAAALAAETFPVTDVVKTLRQMSSDTRAASAMVKSLATWTDASTQQASLASFYDELSSEIKAALDASVSSKGTYKETTRAVLGTLGRVVSLDASARTLAGGTDIQLPAVTIPAVLR